MRRIATGTETIDATFQFIRPVHFMSIRMLIGRQITLVITQGMYFRIYTVCPMWMKK